MNYRGDPQMPIWLQIVYFIILSPLLLALLVCKVISTAFDFIWKRL